MKAELVEGGSWEPLVAVTARDTRLLLDGTSGVPMLDPLGERGAPATCGGFDWAIFGQPRQDSLALLDGPLSETPALVGPETGRVLTLFAEHAGLPAPELRLGFRPGHTVQLDDVRITPVPGQAPGGDGCALLLQGEGQTALHLGGCRVTEELLTRIRDLAGGRIDLLIAGEACPVGAEDLQWDLRRVMPCPGTVFVVASPLDGPLIQAATQAAREAGRAVWEDRFQQQVRQRPIGAVFDPQDRTAAAGIGGSPGRKMGFIRPSMLPFVQAWLDAEREREPPVVYAPSRGRGLPDAALLDFCCRRGVKFYAGTGYARAREQQDRAEAILQPRSTLTLPAELPAAVQAFRKMEREPDALLRELLQRAGPRILVMALKGADKRTRRRFFSAMGPARAQELSRRIDSAATIRVKDVANSQWLLLRWADLLRRPASGQSNTQEQEADK